MENRSMDLPRTMQAAHFRGNGQIDLVPKPVPIPEPGHLLLRVKANALCGSERGQYADGAAITPGHEAAGVVAAAGANTCTAVGTPGVVFLMDFCGTCRHCQHGFTNQCLHKRGDLGFNRDGGYAEYELVPETVFFAVDEALPLDDATLLLDIMGTGGHALTRGCLLQPEPRSILIAGAGPMGLGVLAIAKLRFGTDMPVVIADVVDARLHLAEQLGGLPIHLGRQTLTDGLRAHGWDRCDLAIDTSGKGAARRASMDLLAQRGVLVCVGHGEGLDLVVSPDLIAPERAVLGSEYFRYDELAANLDLLRVHRAYLRQIITHRFPLADIGQAFQLFWSGATGKVVIQL